MFVVGVTKGSNGQLHVYHWCDQWLQWTITCLPLVWPNTPITKHKTVNTTKHKFLWKPPIFQTLEHPRLKSFKKTWNRKSNHRQWFEQVTSTQGHNLQLCWAVSIPSVTSLCLVMGDLTLAYPHLLSQKEERKREKKKKKQNPKEIEQIKERRKKAKDFSRHFSVHDMPASIICHLSSLVAWHLWRNPRFSHLLHDTCEEIGGLSTCNVHLAATHPSSPSVFIITLLIWLLTQTFFHEFKSWLPTQNNPSIIRFFKELSHPTPKKKKKIPEILQTSSNCKVPRLQKGASEIHLHMQISQEETFS